MLTPALLLGAACLAQEWPRPVPLPPIDGEIDPEAPRIPERRFAEQVHADISFDDQLFTSLRPYQDEIQRLGFRLHEPARAAGGNPSVDPRFAIFIEIFKFFIDYANQFSRENDNIYANIGDFRAYYVKRIAKEFPYASWQVEAYKTTAQYNGTTVRNEGGGAGVRWDFHPSESSTLTFLLMPAYGERRSYMSQNLNFQSGSDYILRMSAGASIRQKFGDIAEPGVQVFFQPQWVDLGQFRVYTEAFVRLKIVSDGKSKASQLLQVEEVSIVPKLVYWLSTDKEGLFGDPIQKYFGDSYYAFGKNLYGFLNLEFRFKM